MTVLWRRKIIVKGILSPPAAPEKGEAPRHVHPENIPAVLTDRPQWLCWRYLERAGRGKPGKPPVDPRTGRAIDPADPANWMAFDAALAASRRFRGVGFYLTGKEGLVGIDLDDCLDADGAITPDARAVVERFHSYTEVTVSGAGLRIWIRATLPGTRRRKGKVEVYSKKRYFTVSGDRWPGSTETIEERQGALDAFYAELFAPSPKPAAKPPGPVLDLADDDELIGKARAARNGAKFRRLFDDGNTSGFPSESEADFALAGMLAFYAGPDPGRIRRLFSRSALGQRGKWAARDDYQAATVGNVLIGRTSYYRPPARRAGKPATNGHPAANGRAAPPAPAPPPAEAAPADGFRLTDMGNAERMVAAHRDEIRHVHPWKKWLRWDDRRWCIDRTGSVRRLAKATVRSILLEAAKSEDDERRAALAKWAVASENRARVDAMISLAADDVPALPEGLDGDPWLLNVGNGTIDLKTGLLREHRRDDFITQLCPVPYVADAECPLWDSTIMLVFAGRTDVIAYWQRLCGIALTGTVSEQILPVAFGSGSNGKSTILTAILEMMGTDYAMKAMPDLLMAKKQETHPTDRADLFGKRLVVCIETAEGARLNETMIKELTGSDRIRARRMREDPWEFSPSHKLILATNHKPRVRGTDHAIWRRLKLLPFTTTIPDHLAIKDMPQRLRAEFPGILAWCVRGCLDWQNRGLQEPRDVTLATEGYRQSEDVLGAFLADECVVNPSVRSKSSPLFERYKSWCERTGETALTQRRFGEALTERGLERYTNDGTWYRGVGLRSDNESY